jgi:hypothetical protein
VLGIDLARHLGIELGIDLAGGGAVVPPPEVPLTIPGLGAWYDSRTNDYFALREVSPTEKYITTWLSRAGSMGAVPLTQGIASNQPLRVLGAAVMNNQQSVLLDGVDDFMSAAVAADWTFLHDGSGHTVVTVERVDSTDDSNSTLMGTTSGNNLNSGIYQNFATANMTLRISNSSGAGFVSNWAVAAPTHYARDVSRWRAEAHVTGTRTSAVSGSLLTNPDTVGQPPSAVNPEYPLRLGRSANAVTSYKGHIPQILVYKRGLTAPEMASLGAFFAPIYGVAA